MIKRCMNNDLYRSIEMAITLLFLLVWPSFAETIVSDFEDNTTQGWTLLDPVYTDFYIETDGSEHWLVGIDPVGGHGGPVIVAPSEFLGNLTAYEGIAFDEYIFFRGHSDMLRGSLMVKLFGSDGTFYELKDITYGPFNTWHNHYIPFVESYWKPLNGTLPFEQVLQNVVQIQIMLECSTSGVDEAKIDNITLVPEPSSICLLTLGGLALIRKRK